MSTDRLYADGSCEVSIAASEWSALLKTQA